MKVIWDTDTCIYFLNGNSTIAEKCKEIGADNICTTIINILELRFGAYNSKKIESNLDRIDKLQLKLPILDDLDEEVVTLFAKNKAKLRKKGIAISDFDILISSFAIANNFHIVTNNVKHFKHIPGVKIVNWLSGDNDT